MLLHMVLVFGLKAALAVLGTLRQYALSLVLLLLLVENLLVQGGESSLVHIKVSCIARAL